jgi:hypothetical protein
MGSSPPYQSPKTALSESQEFESLPGYHLIPSKYSQINRFFAIKPVTLHIPSIYRTPAPNKLKKSHERASFFSAGRQLIIGKIGEHPSRDSIFLSIVSFYADFVES